MRRSFLASIPARSWRSSLRRPIAATLQDYKSPSQSVVNNGTHRVKNALRACCGFDRAAREVRAPIFRGGRSHCRAQRSA
jgi:hypothetical protein